MKASIFAASLGLLAFGVALFGAGSADKAKEVFDQNCSVCHNPDSTEAKVGPGLKGLFKKDALVTKKKPSDASVLDLINKGSENGMPPFGDQLSDQEKQDLIAYLKTL